MSQKRSWWKSKAHPGNSSTSKVTAWNLEGKPEPEGSLHAESHNIPKPSSSRPDAGIASLIIGIPKIDEMLLYNPASLQSIESASKLLKLARIEQLATDARHRALQYALSETKYQLHLYQEQLSRTDSQLTTIDLGINRLQTMIRDAGLVLDIEWVDKALFEAATSNNDDDVGVDGL